MHDSQEGDDYSQVAVTDRIFPSNPPPVADAMRRPTLMSEDSLNSSGYIGSPTDPMGYDSDILPPNIRKCLYKIIFLMVSRPLAEWLGGQSCHETSQAGFESLWGGFESENK